MMELEKLIQNPHDEERVRFLEGHDLKPADAQGKLEEVIYLSYLQLLRRFLYILGVSSFSCDVHAFIKNLLIM